MGSPLFRIPREIRTQTYEYICGHQLIHLTAMRATKASISTNTSVSPKTQGISAGMVRFFDGNVTCLQNSCRHARSCDITSYTLYPSPCHPLSYLVMPRVICRLDLRCSQTCQQIHAKARKVAYATNISTGLRQSHDLQRQSRRVYVRVYKPLGSG